MVGDGEIRFNKGKDPDGDTFSLSLLIEALQERPGPVVRFYIETAYRPNDVSDPDTRGADHFSFDFLEKRKDLENFDEVWLFGDEIILPGPSPVPMRDDEVCVLFKWMENGNGVFATGDHTNLGEALNSNIPRVRSMRKWQNDTPPAGGRDRHDTLRSGDGVNYFEDDQGDTIPQEILPEPYPYKNIKNSVEYHHPLLCGQAGAIKVLPDHMHEGECCVPPLDLPMVLSCPALDLPVQDFPDQGGVKPMPQLVARSQAVGRHTTIKIIGGVRIEDVPVEPIPFIAIAAYDGHPINRGRVVVDSSFHHFVNVNLTGFANGDKSVPNQGLYAYEEIKSYFRNIGVWLAPKDVQRSIFIRALWEARWRSRLAFELKNVPEEFVLDEHWRIVQDIAISARKVIDHILSRCLSLEWAIDIINEAKVTDMELNLRVPWSGVKPLDSDLTTDFDAEELINTVIGGAIFALAHKFRSKEGVPDNLSLEQVEGEIKGGVKIGVQCYLKAISQSITDLRALSDNFVIAFGL